MLKQFSVEEQTAIVTGSSQGIGEVTAKRFANEGARSEERRVGKECRL